MEGIIIAKNYITQAETVTEKFYIKSSSVLRIVARVCLLSSFIDNNLYRCINWSYNVKFVADTWGCGEIVASTVILFNIIGVFVAIYMILLQKRVVHACSFLLYIIILRSGTVAVATFWDYREIFPSVDILLKTLLKYLLKEFSVVGSVFMILVENLSTDDSHVIFRGDRKRSFLQLCGRCLLVLMFITTLQDQRPSPLLIVQDVVAGTLMVLVVMGYKTRLSALVLAALLMVLNLSNNDWWNADKAFNYLKYEFFQAFTVVGGLLMVVILGPGDLSVDVAKKHL